jgi:ABC-type transport system involved in multi-copper enzyme maturation permease subunit
MISAITLAWVCFVIVLIQKGNRAHEIPPMSYAAYVWKAVYNGYARDFFIILVIVLGGGGLLQEQAHGTAGFTLVLPVSRSRLMSVRVAVGLAEVAFLALVPALVITAFSPVVGEQYQLSQALLFSVLWVIGGALVFGAAVLLSTVLAGDHSGWIVCFLCVMLYSAAVNITSLQRFPSLDVFKIMSGSGMVYFDAVDYRLKGPMPWAQVSIVLAVAIGLIRLADRFTQRRDY